MKMKTNGAIPAVKSALAMALVAAVLAPASTVSAATEEERARAQQWLDEFQPSTLSKQAQMEEMAWFIDAAKPFKGMEIKVASERIATHKYESKVLAKAFSEITGIELTHETMGEGNVIKNVVDEYENSANNYDAYVNDTDLIGTHFRSGDVVILSDYMEGEGSEVTLPTLDLDDFIGKAFASGPEGRLYQLPDQQFANLYWFRYDWFQREDLRSQFEAQYGYELGVPVNWSAYQDIAEFFSEDVGEIDGEKVYGHMDYGKPGPSLGWRFTDAWFSMAGEGDPGLPNGLPVDEWGIRMYGCSPVASSVKRGGGTNSPAAVYALEKYMNWLKDYAPDKAMDMNFTEAGPVAGQGRVAQQIFWYTAFTESMTKPELPVTDADGNPKWRMAPSPHGPYWEEGMKLGYQDVGGWTLFKHTPPKRRKAAWLYAQFVTSKTVSLKKTLTGLTPIRESDINSEAMTEAAPKLGGLVEFYRSPARELWTPTGINVPDYPKMAALWAPNISKAISGELSPRKALDRLARQQDEALREVGKTQDIDYCKPNLYIDRGREFWLNQSGAPKPELEDEKPPGKTIPYDQLVQQWQQSG